MLFLRVFFICISEQEKEIDMGSPEISFIVPLYRFTESELNRCLQSIGKSAPDVSYEIILVLDGEEQAKSVPDYSAYPHLILIERPHQGVSATRNAGIAQARGKWIAFVDVDDLVASGAYSDLLYVANANDSVDLVVSNHIRRYGNVDAPILNYSEPVQEWTSEQFISMVLKPACDGGTVWGSLFRRTTVMSMPGWFSERLSNGEDIEFLVRFIAHCKHVQSMDRISYVYTINTSSSVRSFDTEYVRKMRLTIDAVHHDLKMNFPMALIDDIFPSFLLDRFLLCLRNYVFNPQHMKGARSRFRTLRNDACMQYAFAHMDGKLFEKMKYLVLLLSKYRTYCLLKLVYIAEEYLRKKG